VSRSHSSQFLVAEKLHTGGVVRLNEHESHHARSVRRLAKGDEVRLSDGAGNLARGVLVDVPRQGLVEVLVEDAWHSDPTTPRITVIQALVTGDLINDAIAMMTELGVDCFIPWAAERSQVRGDARKVTHRWQKVANEATKQSGRAWLPEVSEPQTLTELLVTLKEFDLLLVGDAESSFSVAEVTFDGAKSSDAKSSGAKSIGVIIGPEGGLTPSEKDFFDELGAHRVSLGSATLRAVTAGVALVAALQAQMPIK
jgi:16S rRNA (uracil1498-N3)-methyltransferase